MSAARVARGGPRLVLRVVACRARVTAAAAGFLARAGCACDARGKGIVSCTGLAAGGVAGAAWLGVDCSADATAALSRTGARAGRRTRGLGCADSTVAGCGDGSGLATGAAAGTSDRSEVDTEPVEAAGAAATAVGAAAATGAAGAVGASPVVGGGGGGVGTGDGTASDGGAVATRAGKNPAGSR